MSYDIQQRLIPGLPKNPYRGGVGAYEGVVCHATATYNDTALNERNYEDGHWQDAFVHFFVDDVSIIQVADTNYLAWGCGGVGNPRYIQIELCQSYDQTKFNNAYDRYVWLIAKILHDKGLGVTDGRTLVSHDWISKNLGGTNHSDPIAYLASHGVSWTQHVTNVIKAYNEMVVGGSNQRPQPITQNSFLLKVKVASLYYYGSPNWDDKKGIVHAGDVFTVVQTLWVNGSKMYKLKSGNYITANPSYVQVM
ncbi:MAG: N-acetylmuramoyl-L-alanine amidase [Bacillota bacterium]|nr:N-acetylmuramoyl-L-alanine amidase [Bacillota bacterium]